MGNQKVPYDRSDSETLDSLASKNAFFGDRKVYLVTHEGDRRLFGIDKTSRMFWVPGDVYDRLDQTQVKLLEEGEAIKASRLLEILDNTPP